MQYHEWTPDASCAVRGILDGRRPADAPIPGSRNGTHEYSAGVQIGMPGSMTHVHSQVTSHTGSKYTESLPGGQNPDYRRSHNALTRANADHTVINGPSAYVECPYAPVGVELGAVGVRYLDVDPRWRVAMARCLGLDGEAGRPLPSGKHVDWCLLLEEIPCTCRRDLSVCCA